MSRLDLIVGPNGAGKSTFVELVLEPVVPGSTFVNADEIAKIRWPEDPMGHSYDAAKIAEETRRRLIALNRPLIAETVFSHPSKLELIDRANDAGYEVALHVVMVPAELAVHRVSARVVAGGHDVPEQKIRQRWVRLWPIVSEAVDRVDTATFWDNSHHEGPGIVALFSQGFCVGSPQWPTWAPAVLVDRWPPYRSGDDAEGQI